MEWMNDGFSFRSIHSLSLSHPIMKCRSFVAMRKKWRKEEKETRGKEKIFMGVKERFKCRRRRHRKKGLLLFSSLSKCVQTWKEEREGKKEMVILSGALSTLRAPSTVPDPRERRNETERRASFKNVCFSSCRCHKKAT